MQILSRVTLLRTTLELSSTLLLSTLLCNVQGARRAVRDVCRVFVVYIVSIARYSHVCSQHMHTRKVGGLSASASVSGWYIVVLELWDPSWAVVVCNNTELRILLTPGQNHSTNTKWHPYLRVQGCILGVPGRELSTGKGPLLLSSNVFRPLGQCGPSMYHGLPAMPASVPSASQGSRRMRIANPVTRRFITFTSQAGRTPPHFKQRAAAGMVGGRGLNIQVPRERRMAGFHDCSKVCASSDED